MCSETPTFITGKFMEKLLKNAKNDETIEVKDLTVEPATGKGDNYASEMIRTIVKYLYRNSDEEVMKTISILVKIAPVAESPTKELLTSFQAFDVEINMMQMTLPQMKNILNEDDICLSAQCLYAEIGAPSFIVLEDLAPLGFRMADRMSGLDLEHSLLVMRNLAKFHASSIAINEKGAKLDTFYNKGVFNHNYPDWWKNFIVNGLRVFAQQLLSWPELDDDRGMYSEKFLKLSPVSYDKVVECMTQKGDKFDVLNHGDCWINNLLFQYNDEGKLIGQTFVDFQLSLWKSPAVDLTNFRSSSLSNDVELHHWEDLLKEYLNVLTKTMLKLQCKTKPLTMEILKNSLEDYAFYGVITSCLFLPVVLIDKSEVVGIDEMQSSKAEDYVNPGLKGLEFRNRILKRLPTWNACGLLDV